jgi:predicted Zn-dependent peptidase
MFLRCGPNSRRFPEGSKEVLVHRRMVALVAVATLLLGISVGHAQSLEDRVDSLRLDNGMLFLLVNRPQAPVFSGAVMIRVGGVDDPQGQTGMSHLFEHMAFKGTPWIGTKDYAAEVQVLRRIDSVAVLYTKTLSPIPIADRDLLGSLSERAKLDLTKSMPGLTQLSIEPAIAAALAETLKAAPDRYPSLARYVEARGHYAEMKRLSAEQKKYGIKDEFSKIVRVNGGANFNAGTGKDYTMYYESFPANRLELWAMLESQRFMYPVMREFYSERDVVAEERRMRIDDDPEGKVYEQFLATAMQAHPYRVPIVGWMSDIQRVTAEDAMRFRAKYYVPSNAIGVLVGKLDIAKTRETIRRYFERIPVGTEPIPVVRTLEPPQKGERRSEVHFDAEPMIMVGYHKPNYPHPDAIVFSAIANIIRDSGNSSRLYKSMIKPGLAAEVSIYEELPGSRYPNLCLFQIKPNTPRTAADMETALYGELDSLANHPVSDFELRKCKNQLEADYIRKLADNTNLARSLARAQLVSGSWRFVTEHRKRVAKVTREDIMRVAKKYFGRDNRTVITLVKTSATTSMK